MATLQNQAIDQALATTPRWSRTDGKLRATFEFDSFVAAFGFMSSVALLAEKADHHPDWSNSYNRVDIELVTHSAGGITQKDLDLVTAIEALRPAVK
jgi:4a-hydroxytetrahydrobiopterin dehydratase